MGLLKGGKSAGKLTKEQEAILRSKGNIQINAVAGSGKTTTLIAYARTRPAGSRILYLAFNKSVKLEAQKKFAEAGLEGVKVETAHSLAYKHVVFRHGYKVAPQGYKTHEVAQLLGLKGSGEKHAEYIIANHILKFVTYFCNSEAAKVQDLDYHATVTDEKAKAFVRTFYKPIEQGTRELLAKMDRGEIAITHDFYLKKFQLQKPVLPYDYILFDEGQDASAAMLHIFLQQAATKVIVGDTHQQIYSWRYAVNSLEQTRFKTYHLSTSFRFGPEIGGLATGVLAWKKHLAPIDPVPIQGGGKGPKGKTKATIARTNLGLLLKAIEYITTHKEVAHIYFEGNIHSYTYADEGTSLYDVLSLANGNHDSIRDSLVQSMQDLEDLEDYIEKTEDVQLGMMVEIVKEYGKAIPGILKTLKEKHTGDDEKDKAEMIFSTVHRCKGMEYDSIQLVADFVTEGRLEKIKEEGKKEGAPDPARWNEEINLLYVAVTRTRSSIRIPETLLPKGLAESPLIQVVPVKKEDKKQVALPPSYKDRHPKSTYTKPLLKDKGASYAQLRQSLKERSRPWTEELDQQLADLYQEGVHVMEIARQLKQKTGAVLSRLKKLKL